MACGATRTAIQSLALHDGRPAPAPPTPTRVSAAARNFRIPDRALDASVTPELGRPGGRSTDVFVLRQGGDDDRRERMTPSELSSLRAEALFASALQRSDHPTPTQVRAAVLASLRCYGARSCAARVAEEFGEHPTEAVGRMSWVLAELRSAYPQMRARRHRRQLHTVDITSTINGDVPPGGGGH